MASLEIQRAKFNDLWSIMQVDEHRWPHRYAAAFHIWRTRSRAAQDKMLEKAAGGIGSKNPYFFVQDFLSSISSGYHPDIDGTSREQQDHHGTISRQLNESYPMRAMTKSQLAKKAGVSERTLQRWLKDPYIRQQFCRLWY